MKHLFTKALIFLFWSCPLMAEFESQTEDGRVNYVSINIEVRELQQSGEILREAASNLSRVLTKASENLESLTPEQLTLINSLADKMENITHKLNLSVTNIPSTIKQAQTPTAELLQQSLDQVKAATITPIISTLQTWLIITVVSLCLLACVVFIVSAYCMKQVGKLGSTIKEIADDYRVIPAEQYQEMHEFTDRKEQD